MVSLGRQCEFTGTAELLMNSVPIPCARLSASSARRISGPKSSLSKVSRSGDFKRTTSKVRVLRNPSKWARLLAELRESQSRCCASDCRVLENDFNVFSVYGSSSSAGVSLLVGRSLDADADVVFAGDRGQLVVADVTVKSFEFLLVAVYAPNTAVERVSFFVSWHRSWTIPNGLS